MTTKKPKAPASPAKGNKTTKKTASPKPAQGGKKPSLSQQKRLRALRGSEVGVKTGTPPVAVQRPYKPAPDGVNRIYEDGSQTLVHVPTPLHENALRTYDGWKEYTPEDAQRSKSFRELRDEHERALEKRIPYPEPYPVGTLVETGPLVEGLYTAQKRDTATDSGRLKKLLHAAIGVLALGVVVAYYGGWV